MFFATHLKKRAATSITARTNRVLSNASRDLLQSFAVRSGTSKSLVRRISHWLACSSKKKDRNREVSDRYRIRPASARTRKPTDDRRHFDPARKIVGRPLRW